MKHELIEDLFSVVQVDGERRSVQLSDEDHPIFKAHFPSNPILPGFVHLEIIARVFDLQISSVKKAKFTKMVSPSELLVYEKNDMKFKVFSKDIEVASFSL
jgi:3-hydroxyacyl-[acyl-carrier-protein] dehydratase